jgi:C-terminal processing protease CtpA/Prc
MTRKQDDGLYHLRHLEKKIYHPKKKRFKGDVYVLTSGPTFSAATLFCNAVKGQKGVILLGEETGGGWYGNNGIMIPSFVLPKTKLSVTFPLFRLVQYNHPEIKGSGIVPDIYVGTSYDALLKSYDKKLRVAKKMILEKSATTTVFTNGE